FTSNAFRLRILASVQPGQRCPLPTIGTASMCMIWKFETADFRVTVTAHDDFDTDMSWDEDGSAQRGIDSGALEVFRVEARCTHIPTGIEGRDDLGGCIYKNISDFRDNLGIARKRRESGKNYGSYFSDMVSACIAECRANLDK